MRVRNLEGGGMVGGPQLSLPLLMPQKGVLWLAPLPIPHVQFLRGDGLGMWEEGVV